MANYITEDDIEQSLLQILEGGEFKYNIIRCNANPQTKENLNDGTFRTLKKQCVLPQDLKNALYKSIPIFQKKISMV